MYRGAQLDVLEMTNLESSGRIDVRAQQPETHEKKMATLLLQKLRSGLFVGYLFQQRGTY